MFTRWTTTAMAAVSGMLAPAVASAHHEALFGPQSSLAIESQGFVSLQTHLHAYGINRQQTMETTTMLSWGLQPIADLPLGLVRTGPFSACDGCLRMENTLFATQYRFDFTGLQRAGGKDGNFALVSVAPELPTGNKDYSPFKGPFNFIGAAMVRLEKGAWSSVALAYYRLNTLDSISSKQHYNYLAALGVAPTAADRVTAILR